MVNGWPRSYRDFVYGMRVLAQEQAANSLRMATAFQMGSGFANKNDANRWIATMKRAAGWH